MRKLSPIAIFFIALGMVVLLWVLNFLLLYNHPKQGIIGDMFGAVNALYGGLALAGIIYTLIIQHRDLNDARQQAEEQCRNSRIQTFENTYFQMLRLNTEIVNSIQLPGQQDMMRGRGCFEEIYETWLYMQYDAQKRNHKKKSERRKVNDAYVNFFKFGQMVIGHYFRHLLNCLHFIDTGNIRNKQLYADLLIAHLSSFELALLFYHCLSDVGRISFKPLVEKFGLLEDLNQSLLFKPNHIYLYEESAFDSLIIKVPDSLSRTKVPLETIDDPNEFERILKKNAAKKEEKKISEESKKTEKQPAKTDKPEPQESSLTPSEKPSEPKDSPTPPEKPVEPPGKPAEPPEKPVEPPEKPVEPKDVSPPPPDSDSKSDKSES